MPNSTRITDYNFTHGLHRGQNGFYRPILPEDLNRPLTHDEMDYNIQLIGGIIGGYRVIGTGTNGVLDINNDANKNLKLYRVTSNDTEIIASGSNIDDLVWVVDTMVLSLEEITSDLIPDQNEVYDLGSPTKKFKDLYLSNNTIYLGANSMSMVDGVLHVNGSPLNLNVGSDLLADVSNIASQLGIETELRTTAISNINEELTSLSNENGALAQSVLDLDTKFTADLTDAITGETLARTTAISNVTQELTSLSNKNGALAQSITDLSAEFQTDLTDAITGETLARTTAISGITEELTSLTNADFALAQSITDLSAEFQTDLTDAITGETLTRTTAISNVTQELTSLSNANQAIAQSITDLSAAFTAEIDSKITGESGIRTTAISNINEELTSLSNENGALAQSITDLSAEFQTDLTDAITGETSARTTAISNITQELTSLTNANQAIAQSITDLSAEFQTDLTDAITGETSARTTAISNITQELTALSNASQAIAQSVTNLGTSFSTELNTKISAEETARNNAIAAEILARNAAIQAVADLVPTEANLDGLASTADLQEEALERARLLGLETVARTSAISDITEELTSLTNADLALAQSINTLGSTFTTDLEDAVTGQNLLRTTAIAGVQDSITALTTANQAIVNSINSLGTQFDIDIDAAIAAEAALRATAITNVTNQIAALSDANSASVTRVDTLEAQYTIEGGAITGFSESSALKTTIDSAIATANQATVSSTTDLIATLNGQVAGVTQGISANVDALTDKINAQYTLEVNADGNVAGMKLGANETGSSIAFTADSFKVSTGGPQGQLLTPFSIINGQVAFNGAVSFSAGPQGPAGTPGADGAPGAPGLDGAPGAEGSAGANARAVNLTCTDQVFTYNTSGTTPFPVNTVITATPLNTSGQPYYRFYLNGDQVSAGQLPTYTYTPRSSFTNMPDTIKVEMREGNNNESTPILARDQITMSGIKPGADGTNGTDGMTVILSNEAHTLPTTNAGVVTYLGSGTTIRVFEGANEIMYDGSGTGYSTWKITSVAVGITRGTLTDSGMFLTIGDHGSMTQNTASITYTITGKRLNGTDFSFTKTQTFAKSIQGAQGATGVNARAVNLTCADQVFTYNTSGISPSPSNTVITAAALNTSGAVYYQFFKNGETSVQNGTSTTYVYTPQSNFTGMPDKIEVRIREGGLTGPILARDQITMSGIKPGANGTNGAPGDDGADGMTIILSNEAHTLPTTSGGVVTYTGSGTTIRVFEGANEVLYDGAGTEASRWKLTASPTSITTGSITDSGNYANIGQHSNMTQNTASITYTITGKRLNGTDFSFTKSQSFAKSIQGATGPQGPAPDTSTYLTQSTLINGGTITTGILKNGAFRLPDVAAIGSGEGAGEIELAALADAPWNTYADAGMGINLDKGAINAKNFYIDPAGNAKFNGDLDVENGATIAGGLASTIFDFELDSNDAPVLEGGYRKLRFRPEVKFGDTQFSAFKTDFQTIAENYASRYEDVTYDSNSGATISESSESPNRTGELNGGNGFTAAHMYIKRNDIQIEVGDLVKLDENNELVKASSAQDTAIVGILWQGLDFTIKESPLDKFLPNGKDTSEKPHHYRDSLGNKIPVDDRDIKTIWRVASIGDSREGGLTGMKVCDQNGPVLKGDLVCSSDTPGYVMKQPTEWVIIGFEDGTPLYEERQNITSYTVGKCMEDCAFDTEGKVEGVYGYLYCG
jgi:alkylhydroperoxidase/carboxymuconolactone decarboxylase family protein YurZ